MKGIKTGYLLIWIAILIFAAANSIVSMLVDIGAANKIDDRNPVSLCNILFVGKGFLPVFYFKSMTELSSE
jgi:hypothetical protein